MRTNLNAFLRAFVIVMTIGFATHQTLGAEEAAVAAREVFQRRVLAALPMESDAFLAYVGEVSGDYTNDVVSFNPAGETIRRVHHLTQYGYQEKSHRARLVSTIGMANAPTEVYVISQNPDYSFELAKNSLDAEFFISRSGKAGIYGVGKNRWLFTPYAVSAAPLTDVVKGTGGRVLSVEPIVVDGKPLTLMTYDRGFANSKTTMPAWAILDPARHDAVIEYSQHYLWGEVHGWVEYSDEITDIAFPRRIIEQEAAYGMGVANVSDLKFTTPAPCNSPAEDYTLESFGLERPHSPAAAATPEKNAGAASSIETTAVSTSDTPAARRGGPGSAPTLLIAVRSSLVAASAITIAMLGIRFFRRAPTSSITAANG